MVTLVSKRWEIVMFTTRMVCLAIAVTFAVAATHAVSDEPKSVTKEENRLLGTWKLVSAKFGGTEFKIPEGNTQVKHVTPVQFMWAWYDKDGKVTGALGGSYTLKGEDYEEVPEYGVGESLLETLKGKTQSFKWKIEGNKWYHNGKLSSGLTIDEVWERVEKK
jgi:hypothetical protein